MLLVPKCLASMATTNSLFLLRGPLSFRALGVVGSSKGRLPQCPKLFYPALHCRRSYVIAATDEEASASLSVVTADSRASTIFDKIIAKEIPSTTVYEDEKVLAFRDINPQAPVHVLIIPKLRDGLSRLSKAEEKHTEILGHLLYVAKVVADKEGILDGFRVVINDGPQGCQSVYHLHLHVLGGRQMKWPPG